MPRFCVQFRSANSMALFRAGLRGNPFSTCPAKDEDRIWATAQFIGGRI